MTHDMRRTRGRWAALAGVAAVAGVVLTGGPAAAYQIADGLTLNGKFYADATWSEHDDDSGFHLRRSYLMLKADVQPGLKARLTLDQRSEAETVFVKHAYVEKTLPHDMAVWAGLAGTPYVPYDEAHFWGYRYVERSFTDYWGMQSSTDLGASLLGTAAEGKVAYQVSLLNGEGYQNTPDGNGFALAGRGNLDQGNLHAGFFFHEERARGGVTDYNPSREGIFAFWDDGSVRAGAQAVIADDGNAAGVPFDKARGLNFQGQIKLPTKAREVWAFGRWDDVRPVKGSGHRFYGIAGIATEVAKGLTLAPNVRVLDTGIASRGTEYMAGVNAQLLL